MDILEIVKNLKTQSNRGTATPYYYVVQSKRTVWVEDSQGEPYHWDGESFYTFPQYNSSLPDDEKITFDQFLCLDNVTNGLWEKEVIYGDEIFLTEEAVENHIKQYGYRYDEEPTSYMKFAGKESDLAIVLDYLKTTVGEV